MPGNPTRQPTRRPTVSVDVGGVLVGSAHPIVVQSMTNTDTADADATAIQVARLAHAGSQLVRITVNTEEAAAAVPEIMRKLHDLGVDVPVIGDFHYNGHKLLVDYPEMARSLAKYRINPGNVGAKRHDEHFATIVRVAIDNHKPVRIGVNWGSLDQQLLTELMDVNARAAEPRDARDVMIEAMIESAMRSAELAEGTGLGHDRIIISAKVSQVRDLVDVYRLLAARSDSDRSCPRSPPARAAVERPRRSSRRWPSRSSAISRLECPNGRRSIRASRRCGSPSWAASSTAPGSRSTQTSASRCRERSRSRWRLSSSMASSTGRSGVRVSSSSSSGSWRTTSPGNIRRRGRIGGRSRSPRRRSNRVPSTGLGLAGPIGGLPSLVRAAVRSRSFSPDSHREIIGNDAAIGTGRDHAEFGHLYAVRG